MALSVWLHNHASNLARAARKMARSPLGSLMTISVIAITLSLPAGLYVVLENAQKLVAGWEGKPQISLYLLKSSTPEGANRLVEQIRALADVSEVTYISPDQGLKDFQAVSGFGEALNVLDENPLPAVIKVRPSVEAEKPEASRALYEQLKSLAGVESAQMDLAWVQRLHTLLELGKRAAWVLSGLLGIAILLVVGNTIRLAIINRRDEIEIIKLIGGSDAFIRRPFLYSGFLQGLLGGVMAWLLLVLAIALLARPARKLAELYGSESLLTYPSVLTGLTLVLIGAALGWLGSRLAVARHLRDIKPR